MTAVGLQLGQILKHKQAEAALRESEATNRAIVRAIPDLLVRVDRTGKYTQLLSLGSIQALNLLKEVPAPTIFDALPQELATQKVDAVRRALATGEMQIYEHEILIEGAWQWEEVRVTPMSADEVLIIVRNITDRKQAETALQELNQELEARVQQRTAALQASEARYRALMENASDAILLADLEGNITEGNRKAEELLGYTQAELRRLHFTQIHPLEELPRTIASFTDGISSGASQLLDGLMLRKDGTLVPVDITCSVVEVAGKRIVQGIFGTSAIASTWKPNCGKRALTCWRHSASPIWAVGNLT
ncbi:MAG: PAS domain S-box protein [Coleofasciculaceae cyanobacterium SM2_3_26]|nr:PAS domain S-box protein [Coleofasciculaceae cyanobacterium SM2_3_26]